MWLDEHLIAPIAHRQVVLTLPKRLRAYFVHDRRRLGLLSRVATRTLRLRPGRDDAERAEVERVADRVEGPYAGVHRMSALEFLAR